MGGSHPTLRDFGLVANKKAKLWVLCFRYFEILNLLPIEHQKHGSKLQNFRKSFMKIHRNKTNGSMSNQIFQNWARKFDWSINLTLTSIRHGKLYQPKYRIVWNKQPMFLMFYWQENQNLKMYEISHPCFWCFIYLAKTLKYHNVCLFLLIFPHFFMRSVYKCVRHWSFWIWKSA